jgi:hypothetical protein
VRAGYAQAWFDGTVHTAANAAILGVLGYGGTMVLSGTIRCVSIPYFGRLLCFLDDYYVLTYYDTHSCVLLFSFSAGDLASFLLYSMLVAGNIRCVSIPYFRRIF